MASISSSDSPRCSRRAARSTEKGPNTVCSILRCDQFHRFLRASRSESTIESPQRLDAALDARGLSVMYISDMKFRINRRPFSASPRVQRRTRGYEIQKATQCVARSCFIVDAVSHVGCRLNGAVGRNSGFSRYRDRSVGCCRAERHRNHHQQRDRSNAYQHHRRRRDLQIQLIAARRLPRYGSRPADSRLPRFPQ